MKKIEVFLDEETLTRAKWLAKAHGYTIPELIVEAIKRLSIEEVDKYPFLGGWEDDAELVDKIINETVQQRNYHQLLQSINEAYVDGLDDSEQAMLEGMRCHQRYLQEQE